MLKYFKGMLRRPVVVAAAALLLAAPPAGASWRFEDRSTRPPASASSVVTSSSTITTSSSTSTSVSTPDEVQTTAEARSIPQLAVNETEPRFIGSLKKKLCSVGLGLNKELVFKGCKDTGVAKLRVTRQTSENSDDPATRLIGLLGGLGSGSGLDGLKGPAFVPSFGVNFGSLPTGGGYGPYGSPYGGNPLGLDLGPVSVNPFVGFKVAKLDGRPILNPTFDLLVTPNAKGVHALNGLKEGIKHQFGGGYPGPYPGPVPGPYPGPVPGPYPGPVPGPLPGPVPGPYPVPVPYPSTPYNPYPQQPVPPVYTPPKPVYTPPKPVYTPPKPVYTPPKPIYTPPNPIYTPPVYTPPVKPIADYSNQHHKPPGYVAPVADYSPAVHIPQRPISGFHGDNPVEVHHHEHTHYHDHDHDHHDSSRPFTSGGFVPSLQGFGRSDLRLDDDEPLPLSSSPSSSLSSPSSSFFPSSSSKFDRSGSSKVTFSTRASDSPKSSSSGSSFKFPDS